MKKRLVVLTEIISPYRIPVFNALAKRPEIDLHVIFLAETDSPMRQWQVYSSEIQFSYEVLQSWRRRLGKYNVLVNRNVAEALREAHPDVILCGGYNYLASWQTLHWAKRNLVPFLLWCESTAGDRRSQHLLVERLKQSFLRSCDGFVVPGKSALQYLQQTPDCSGDIFIAPNAVDIQLFSAQGDLARAKQGRLRGALGLPSRYFLFVGRLVKAKGVFDLLDAYGSLSPELRAEVGLVFAGDGPLRADLEAMARSVFPGSVHFPGFIHRDELPTYYSLAECLVLPTHSDTWGMVVNEAMACGLPIICSSVAGCATDLIKNNGRIVASGDVEQLRTAMREIASDPELRRFMVEQGRILIRNYSPESCAYGIAEAVLTVPNCASSHTPRPAAGVEVSPAGASK